MRFPFPLPFSPGPQGLGGGGCEGYSPLHPPSFPLPASAWRPLSGLPFSCQPLRAGKQEQDERRGLRSLALLPFGHWTEEPRTCQATEPTGGHRFRLWQGSPAAAVTWQLRWSGKPVPGLAWTLPSAFGQSPCHSLGPWQALEEGRG